MKKIKLTQHRNLMFLYILLVAAMISLAFFMLFMIDGRTWERVVWMALAASVVIGTVIELMAVRIVYPSCPYARTLNDNELRNIRGDGYKGKMK